MKPLKVAVCVDKLKMGGSTFSAALIASGLANRNYRTSFVATRPFPGKLPISLEESNLDICTPCEGIHQFRQGLKRVSSFLLNYDVIINNHSNETRLVVPSLPERIIRIATIRSVAPSFVITDAVSSSMYFDALVGISPDVCNSLRSAGAKTKVKLISNAVEISSSKPPLLHDRCRLLFIGRMENKAKNVLILPRIIAILKTRGVNAFLDIVGDGADMDLLHAEIRRSGCADIIAVHGACSRFEAIEYLSRSNFILVPSHYEGFGLVVAEGMATGCIPVTSNIQVFKWLLGEYASMLQCPLDNPDAYADRITDLFENRHLYMDIQRNLRKRQITEFSPEKTIDKYSNLIEEIKSNKSRHLKSCRSIGTTLPTHLRIRYSLLYNTLSKLWNRFRVSI